MSAYRDLYHKTVQGAMTKKFRYKNINEIPKLEKIVVNCMSRHCVSNNKAVNHIREDLAAITGQRPVTARAKKSIASFKVRQGMAIGAFATLRGEKMYQFLERLIAISLPRVRDFRGVNPRGFDGRGNYTLGLKEHIVFPEINYDKIDQVRGLGISIATTAKTNEEVRKLLTLFGMPFSK